MRAVAALLWLSLALHAAVLSVGGSVKTPLRIDAESFASYPETALGNVGVVCMSGARREAPRERRGVLLRTLIEQAVLKSASPKERNRMVVLASGSDGYGVSFSYHELFNTPVGDGVLVVRTEEGFTLYSRHDTVTGPRHVRDLAAVEVMMITATKTH